MQKSKSIILKFAAASVSTSVFLALGLGLPFIAHAETQMLKATIDGNVFESDDAGIAYLIPIKGTFNLGASTNGSAAYPPPKTPIDRLSIICRGFEGKPIKFVEKDFGTHGCEVQFSKGVSKVPFGDPMALYESRWGQNNMIEITSVKGKVIEGKFHFEMKEKKPKSGAMVMEGTFKAEDRQK